MLLPGLSARHAPLRCAEFSGTSLEQLRQAQAAFVDEREWSQFHTPRSLALAMVGEVGEVCELLQWRGDAGASPGLPGWTDDEREALADELSDVLSYVVRLADVTDIDLPEAFLRKVEKNRAKYPSERARGSAAKYTRYADPAGVAGGAAAPAAAPAAGDGDGREWGTPKRIEDAYARARTRVQEQSPAPAPPSATPAAGASTTVVPPSPPPPAEERYWGTPDWVSSAFERASRRAEGKLASMSGEEAEEAADKSRPRDAGQAQAAGAEQGEALSVESLDELWGLMQYDGPGDSF